jgi:two-component sensor histidine kinase
LIEKSGPLPTVTLKTLFAELIDQIQTSAEVDSRKIVITLDVMDCQVPMDMATPLALFAVEALTLGLYGGDGEAPPVTLALQADGDEHLLLTVYNEVLGDVSLSARVPSPMRVLAALAEQISGRTWIDETQDGKRRLLLRFLRPAQPSPKRAPSDEDLGWGNGENALVGHIYRQRDSGNGNQSP